MNIVLGHTQPESPRTPYSGTVIAQQCWHQWNCGYNPRPVEPSVLDVHVNNHTLRPLCKLGEGGYAIVYLVKEVSVGQNVDPAIRYGLKKVLASTPERLEATKREIAIQQKACHPSLLPLLEWSVVPTATSDPHSGHTVYLLTPAYPDGTLADELNRLTANRAATATAACQGAGQGAGITCLLSTRQVLGIFRQLCLALDALHTAGYAHRDVKTHNVLIKRPTNTSKCNNTNTYGHSQSGYQALTPPLDPLAPTTPTAGAQRFLTKSVSASAYGGHSISGDCHSSAPTMQSDAPTTPQGTFVFPTRSSASGMPPHVPVDAKDVLAAGMAQLNVSEALHDVEAIPAECDGPHDLYSAVLMDFGSAGPRIVEVKSRGEALRLQEDAEANCTATFRAPELFDIPSRCTLDQAAADVWSLGCTLYAAMYGQSPFQISLNQGGSLALSVLNCNIPWPKTPSHTYPLQLHDLVMRCLVVDPAARPTPATLAKEALHLLAVHPPLPNPPAFTPAV